STLRSPITSTLGAGAAADAGPYRRAGASASPPRCASQPRGASSLRFRSRQGSRPAVRFATRAASRAGANGRQTLHGAIASSGAGPAARRRAAGVAAGRAVRSACGVEVGLNWPNDLVWRDRKLGGILVEHGARESGALHVVIGIGINVAVPLAVLGRLSDWPA